MLQSYVEECERELEGHRVVRGGMGVAVSLNPIFSSCYHELPSSDVSKDRAEANIKQFSTRSVNGQKAMANWEKKSSYLLREIVKFRTYIDALQAAKARREEVYREREEREQMKEVESVRHA